MILTGNKHKELTQALVDAFPTKEALSQMLKFQLDKNLNNIVSESNLKGMVFELIQTAKAQGWLEKLLLGAKKENPDNPHLKNITLGSASKADHGTSQPPALTPALAELEVKKRALVNSEKSLLLIEERMSEYVISADIPLQLVKEKRDLEKENR